MKHVGARWLENWLGSGSSKSKLLLQPANFVFKIRSWMSQFRISTHTIQPREPHNPRRDIHESSSTHDLWPQRFKLSCTMETLLKLICHIVVIHPCRLWAFQICMLELHRNKTTTKRNSRNFAELIFKLSSQFFALAAFRVDSLFFLCSIRLRVGCYRAIIGTSVADRN